MQFAFKKTHSTNLCVFALNEVIKYYRRFNTLVYVCFLDIKSAFDRVSYINFFFYKLVIHGVPKYRVLLLQHWYVTQRIYIRWGNTGSEAFNMNNGIRQGSLISPYLFNVRLSAEISLMSYCQPNG